jgi:PhnB protein
MSIKNLNPYIQLNGFAAQAIAFYEEALGAKLESVTRFREVAGMKVAPEHENRVMHALLRIGDGVLMISDLHIALDFDELADMSAKFDALAARGKVGFPIHETFWGAKFGMLTDAFGVHWMFNFERKPS